MKYSIFSSLFLLLSSTSFLNAQNALNFDGNNDVVQTSYSGVLGTANRTFEAWVFVPLSAPAANLAILDYGTNAVGSRNTFAVTSSRGLTFISGGTNANISSPANTVPVNQWVHVAFVLNNALGFLYVNGILVGTGNLSTVNTPSGNENVKIGQRVAGGFIPFHGNIDEIRLWSNARSQSQIQNNMNNELCSVNPDLQLYLQLNEGAAGGNNIGITSAPDASGNNTTALLNGFSLNSAISNWVTAPFLSPGLSLADTVLAECNSYIWPVNGMTYSTSGNYSSTLPGANTNNCDSILILNLTIYPTNDLTTTVNECDSYTWSVNGQTYINTQTVVESLITGQGCQYDHTLNLIIGQSSNDTSFVTACNLYTWPTNGQTYSSSGLYTESFANLSGCDSTVTLDLTINSTPDNSITQNGASLTATQTGATYQWIDCDNFNAPIIGEVNQTFFPSLSGNYAVEVTIGDCSSTSECRLVDFTGIDEVESLISVHPNPTKDEVTLSIGAELLGTGFVLTDNAGRIILTDTFKSTEQKVNLSVFNNGVYYIKTDKESPVKIIKQ